jgi:hypothetical protein
MSTHNKTERDREKELTKDSFLESSNRSFFEEVAGVLEVDFGGGRGGFPPSDFVVPFVDDRLAAFLEGVTDSKITLSSASRFSSNSSTCSSSSSAGLEDLLRLLVFLGS